jgi:hypothetical protein
VDFLFPEMLPSLEFGGAEAVAGDVTDVKAAQLGFHQMD